MELELVACLASLGLTAIGIALAGALYLFCWIVFILARGAIDG